MSGISSSIGLISGIDTANIIDQLMSIESRPKVLAINRMIQLQNQQGAFLSINSLLLTLESAASSFNSKKVFSAKTATSSDSKVLTASASSSAQPGSYQFLVEQLVSTSQKLSKGYADPDETAIGASSISFEFGNGRLETDTLLSDLNGGEGVKRGVIRITDSSGATADIDLSRAVTVSDVLEAINASTTVGVTARVNGDSLEIVDDLGGSGGSTLKVVDVGDDTTASDLGIAATDDGDGVITGTAISRIAGETSLKSLNDGNGVQISSGLNIVDFRIVDRNGNTHDVVLGKRTVGEETEDAVTNLQGVIDRINEATDGAVTASIGADGVSLTLTDSTGGTADLEVTAGSLGSTQTAEDLGILGSVSAATLEGDRIFAGLNSVLVSNLNGGAGLNGATSLTITDRSGNSDSFTLEESASLSEIIDQINASSAIDVTAGLNANGTGLAITDNTGSTISNLIITGDAAAALGVDTGASGVSESSYSGTNLQHQYVSGASLLSDLNYGRGISNGSFRITDAYGGQATITIGSDDKTLQDVIDEINAADLNLTASINSTGDGLLLASTVEDGSTIRVESITGTTAKDLGILGTAESVDDNILDGSYEKTIELETSDTLNDIISKVNSAGIDVTATLINDGAGSRPYHISFTSKISGLAGDLIVDAGDVDLGLTDLTKAQDAVVFFGSGNPADAILMTSSTNSLDNVISGVTIDLKSASDNPVTLTISNNTQSMVDSVNSFVDAFNDVISKLNELSKYDAETEARGVLMSNPTVARVRSQLYRTIQEDAVGVETQYQRLAQVGINIGDDGLLEVDEDTLREAINTDLTAVNNLFAAKKVSENQDDEIGDGITVESQETKYDSLGVAELVSLLAKDLTNSVDGTLTLVNRNYDTLIGIQEDRIEFFDEKLAAKRLSLERQFAQMELNLSALQQQQAALSSLQLISAG